MSKEGELGLPPLSVAGRAACLNVMLKRRSARSFGARALTLSEIGDLLWAGQGSNRPDGGRTTPSAHAVYPITLRLGVGRVSGLATGIYDYESEGHRLAVRGRSDPREALVDAAIGEQPWLRRCALVVAIAGDVASVTRHFAGQAPVGRRGERYLYFEAGHVAQNIQLAAAALGLGAVLVGGFADHDAGQALGCHAQRQRILGLLAIGAGEQAG